MYNVVIERFSRYDNRKGKKDVFSKKCGKYLSKEVRKIVFRDFDINRKTL